MAGHCGLLRLLSGVSLFQPRWLRDALIAQTVQRRTGAGAGDEAKFISHLRGKNFAESSFAAALAAVSGRSQSAFAMRGFPRWSGER
ncbi:hypothetical protein KX75_20440 [Salmonella enterica subsp. enterica]|nr:hypothetical protein [Salmonella enterica subsp. enterica serovar Mikawasima]